MHQITCFTCSHRSSTCQQARRCASLRNGAAIRRPRGLCRCTPCAWNRLPTELKLIRSSTTTFNHHIGPEDIFIQLSIHLPLTVESAIGLTIGDALRMLLSLLLCVTCTHRRNNRRDRGRLVPGTFRLEYQQCIGAPNFLAVVFKKQ